MQVPLLDLKLQYRSVRERVREAIDDVVEEQRFILGPVVDRFEHELASEMRVAHAVGCASGTDALLLSLRALDCGPGSEVVTTPFTFFATAGAIHNAGAKPVFADVLPGTFNLDPAAAAVAVTERTRALIPVHLFGQMADMEAFGALARNRGLHVIEDAAQAIGARERAEDGSWIDVGARGDATALSFFPSKNLGAFGDGGAIVTPRADVAERLRTLRVHGGRKTYHHEEVGYNSRLDALHAAVLSAKLPFLHEWSEARRRHAAFYDQALADIAEVRTPEVAAGAHHVYNQYTIRVAGGRRDALAEHLSERGIGFGIYYPLPLHLQDCFAYLGHREGDFPEAERASREVLSLPVYPELTAAQLQWVADSVRDFFTG